LDLEGAGESSRSFAGAKGKLLLFGDIAGDSALAAMSRVDSIFHTSSIALRHLLCLLDYGVPVFTDDVVSSNYPVFRGPMTL
jgi:hypothetical protein